MTKSCRTWSGRLISAAIVGGLIFSMILSMTGDRGPSNSARVTSYPPNTPIGFQGTTYYTHSDFINIWTAANQSGVYPFPNADQPPYLGMNFFKTRTICAQSYSYADLNNTVLFGDTSTIIYVVSTSTDVAAMNTLANEAKTNIRLRGFMYDDFVAGTVTDTTLHALFDALHHEDANLSQGPLNLILVTYQKDYFANRTAYSWADYDPYYDGISFWLAPSSYDIEWSDLNGYEDAFADLLDMVDNSSKTMWLGVYLYWYDIGDEVDEGAYPDTFQIWQLAQALRFIKNGQADYLNILGSFWILNQPTAAALVRNFIESEYDQNYETYIDDTTNTITTMRNGQATTPAVSEWTSEASTYGGYRFRSDHFQSITFYDPIGYYFPHVQEVQSGHLIHSVASGLGYFETTFYTEPGKTYRIFNMEYTPVTYSEDTTISTPTTWAKKAVVIQGDLILRSTLTLINSTVSFDHFAYERTTLNATVPAYTLLITTAHSYTGRLIMYQSMIEAKHRLFVYKIDTCSLTTEPNFYGGRTSLHNSTIANWAGQFRITNWSYIHDSYFWMPGRDNTNDLGIFLRGLYINYLNFTRNTITLPDQNGAFLYISPGSSYATVWNFHDNSVIGGQYGVYVDGSWCASQDVTLVFNQVAPLSNQVAVNYEHIYLEPGCAIDLSVYEKVRIRTIIGPLTYSIQNVAGGLIDEFTADTGETVTETILECTWQSAGSLTWVNQWPLSMAVSSADRLIESYVVEDKSTIVSNATNTPFALGGMTFTIIQGTDLVKVTSISTTESSADQLRNLIPWAIGLVILFVMIGFAITAYQEGFNFEDIIELVAFLIIGLSVYGIVVRFLG